MPPDGRATSVAVLFDDDSTERIAAAREVAGRLDERAAQQGSGRMRCRLWPLRPGGDAAGDVNGDPYGLTHLLPNLGVEAAVLVAPRRRGSRRLLPGPVVAGVPVGIVQADRCGSLPSLSGCPDPTAPWVVAAMAKDVFLRASDDWAMRLVAVHHAIDLRADRARRDDLLEGLAAGPGVVLYAGHGSPRGWAGYQALRIEHVMNSRLSEGGREGAPAGVVVAFACKTLARHRGRWPFGSSLVEAGAARAYLAPATTVFTTDAERLAEIVVELLVELRVKLDPLANRDGDGSTGPLRVCDLMCLIEHRTMQDAAARRAWATFRLIGDPLTPLV